jgi:hypothetical protein
MAKCFEESKGLLDVPRLSQVWGASGSCHARLRT